MAAARMRRTAEAVSWFIARDPFYAGLADRQDGRTDYIVSYFSTKVKLILALF